MFTRSITHSSLSLFKTTFGTRCSSTLIKTGTFRPILESCRHLDTKSLVYFDIDRTLVLPEHEIAEDTHFHFVKKAIRDELPFGYHADTKADYLHSLIYRNSKTRVIEQESVSLVASLKDRNIQTVGLTELPKGSFGGIADLHKWKAASLNQLGYDIFEIQSLNELIPNLNWRPSKILFINDRQEINQLFVKAMNQIAIPSLVYHYTKESKDALDKKKALTQIRHLVQEETF